MVTEIYNYWIRYRDLKTKEIHKIKNNNCPWSVDIDLIDTKRKENIETLLQTGKYEIIGSGINKRGFTQKPLVGILTDNGKTDGKREIMIGEKSFDKEIYDEFHGNKVRLILQVIQ